MEEKVTILPTENTRTANIIRKKVQTTPTIPKSKIEAPTITKSMLRLSNRVYKARMNKSKILELKMKKKFYFREKWTGQLKQPIFLNHPTNDNDENYLKTALPTKNSHTRITHARHQQ